MRVFVLLVIACLAVASVGWAQEKDAPAGPAPQLWLASASRQDGKVVIRIAKPEERGAPGGMGGFEPGVRSLPATTVMKWSEFPRVTLGPTVRAFSADGKAADADAVLGALAKPKGVAVFVRSKEKDPTTPDPFYLALLRADTLVLVVDHKDLYPSEP
jgi:hypothetical protein